jgi:hypothetical protein
MPYNPWRCWGVFKVLWNPIFEDPSVWGITATFDGHVLETDDWKPYMLPPFERLAEPSIPRVNIDELIHKEPPLQRIYFHTELQLVEVAGRGTGYTFISL